MSGTTRPQVDLFENRFGKLRLIKHNSRLPITTFLLGAAAQDGGYPPWP